MDNPAIRELEKLPRETLIELIKVFSRNWSMLDGLWFSLVEEKYGLDAAVELDVKMWEIGSRSFCPPDSREDDAWCRWEFTLSEKHTDPPGEK